MLRLDVVCGERVFPFLGGDVLARLAVFPLGQGLSIGLGHATADARVVLAGGRHIGIALGEHWAVATAAIVEAHAAPTTAFRWRGIRVLDVRPVVRRGSDHHRESRRIEADVVLLVNRGEFGVLVVAHHARLRGGAAEAQVAGEGRPLAAGDRVADEADEVVLEGLALEAELTAEVTELAGLAAAEAEQAALARQTAGALDAECTHARHAAAEAAEAAAEAAAKAADAADAAETAQAADAAQGADAAKTGDADDLVAERVERRTSTTERRGAADDRQGLADAEGVERGRNRDDQVGDFVHAESVVDALLGVGLLDDLDVVLVDEVGQAELREHLGHDAAERGARHGRDLDARRLVAVHANRRVRLQRLLVRTDVEVRPFEVRAELLHPVRKRQFGRLLDAGPHGGIHAGDDLGVVLAGRRAEAVVAVALAAQLGQFLPRRGGREVNRRLVRVRDVRLLDLHHRQQEALLADALELVELLQV